MCGRMEMKRRKRQTNLDDARGCQQASESVNVLQGLGYGVEQSEEPESVCLTNEWGGILRKSH